MPVPTRRFNNGSLRPIRLMPLVAVLLSGCALYAATSGRVAATNPSAAGDSAGKSRGAEATSAAHFSDRDRRLIREYYRDYYRRAGKNTPPGLARRDRSPPGLAKRRTLPPGLQGRGLPSTLEARLTRLPAAYMRVAIGADVAIVERATRVIIDVIYDVAWL